MNKISVITFLFISIIKLSFAQEAKYQLSSHILDITQGQPAPDVKIQLSKMDKNKQWHLIDEKITDQNGRITDFLKEDPKTSAIGVYKLTYYTQPYFEKLGQQTFYPFIEVVFELKDQSHYHVPITLSPFGYSTYRGN